MRALALLSVLGGLVLVGATGAGVPYVNYPNSLDPVWLSNDLIRFQTNTATRTWTYQPYVVSPDGTGMRPATPEEAAAVPASPTAASPDRGRAVVVDFVGWIYGDGSTLYVVPTDGSLADDGYRDLIDCGTGDDRVRADGVDVVRHCEHVHITSRPAPPPTIP